MSFSKANEAFNYVNCTISFVFLQHFERGKFVLNRAPVMAHVVGENCENLEAVECFQNTEMTHIF